MKGTFQRVLVRRCWNLLWQEEIVALNPSNGRTAMPSSPRSRSGLARIELLVIVGFAALLCALLVPAVQGARERARRAQCQNNLKQLALVCLDHAQVQGHLPTGGWGVAWTGDADLGFGRSQPGGWFYNIWPFLESSPVHDMGLGMSINQKRAAHLRRFAEPCSVFHCPTRRQARAYPWTNSRSIVNAGLPKMVGRNDYAANGGDVYTSVGSPLPPLWKSAPPGEEAGPANPAEGGVDGSKEQAANAKATFDAIADAANGIIFCGSMVKLDQITNGDSNTYLLGEKYIDPDYYESGEDPGDNAAALVGDSQNVARWSFHPPLQDTPGYVAPWQFGSAHPRGFNMAFCDGSVKLTNFGIDPEIHRRMGNREDGGSPHPSPLPKGEGTSHGMPTSPD
jgi:prepilin-type processing-associated H-X9-DG protein